MAIKMAHILKIGAVSKTM